MNSRITVPNYNALSLIRHTLDQCGYAIKGDNAIVPTQRGGYYMRLLDRGSGKFMFAKVLPPCERTTSKREIQGHTYLPRMDAAMYSLDVVRIPSKEGEWVVLVTTLLGEFDLFTWATSDEYTARRGLEGDYVRNDVLQIAHDISTQLARFHKAGLIHGDVKLENIVVSSDAGVSLDALFVLVDLESSQQFCGIRKDRGGTPCYADAFTLCETDEACACSSDTWQLGIVLALMLLHCLPLDNFRHTASKHLNPEQQGLLAIGSEFLASRVIQCAYCDESIGFLPALEKACKEIGLSSLFVLLRSMLSPVPKERPSADAVRAFSRAHLNTCPC